MRYEDAVAARDARQPEHMPGPSLDRITALLALLDDPQLTYPTIHVTGTNGKSTAVRAVAAVACGHELPTGLYLSPHLLDVTERFRVCDTDMTRGEFAAEWQRLQPFLDHVDAMGMGEVTYFEAVTALAFLWFADKPVGLGAIEVGMGGSWDATNLVAGDVAVVTPVGLDHVAELGPTLADIAGEKAGIIKAGKVAVVREQDPTVALVLARRADEVGAHLLHEGADWEVDQPLLAVGGQSFGLRTPKTTYEDLFVPVFGEYAARNTAAGIVAFEALTDRGLDEDALREGLATLRTPGRMEIAAREPLVILDGAHNPEGAAAAAAALARAFRWDRLHVVLAVSANKDVEGVVAPFAGLADVVHAARNDSVRSAEPEVVAEAARGAGAADVRVHERIADAIAAAREDADPADTIVITGSLFTVADAKRALAGA
jgi:dihydrofolate synthase/folylpolyglutamate synthase